MCDLLLTRQDASVRRVSEIEWVEGDSESKSAKVECRSGSRRVAPGERGGRARGTAVRQGERVGERETYCPKVLGARG